MEVAVLRSSLNCEARRTRHTRFPEIHITRAKQQYDKVENQRIDLAGTVLSPPNKS